MKILRQAMLVDEFFERVRQMGKRALFLDYDGTLAPFVVERSEAVPYPGVCELLDEIISTCDCRLVIISGRWLGDLIPLLRLKELPEVWGSHGSERLMPDRKYQIEKSDANALRGLAMAESWVLEQKLARYCERKHSSLALHLRGLSSGESRTIKAKTLEKWSGIAQQSGLTVQEFDGGIELRTTGPNKGVAVDTVLEEMGEGTAAAYLGDDLTDEDAFHAISGRGLAVLVREKLRETAADIWVKPPDELLWFLKRWLEVCREKA
ncbi:MAG: trehalose-phosphatase [Candidatus Glassbacteria bacterium]